MTNIPSIAQLQLSESLLRHLLQALQAPARDQDLARQGKISTNELARSTVAAGLHHRLLRLPVHPLPGSAARGAGCG